ncbi:MAG TPA: hypothetical protein VHF47_05220 [Acidimicrobiales bacterium]|nr:hypothetical protein [Acidimicrobiales bacterium]
MSCKPGVTRQGGVALLLAALLLVVSGLFAGAAVAGPDKEPDRTLNDHPSGKDRTEEPGTSNVQGKSSSDPDGEANGGPDKPLGAGGFDADKDGNNGCGNDDDFEDDNNGNCGGRRVQGANARSGQRTQGQQQGLDVRGNVGDRVVEDTTKTDAERSLQGTPSAAVQALEDTQVLGVSFVRETDAAAAVGGAAVLGTSHAAPSALAATGSPAVELVAVGVLLLATGAALVVGARRRETSLA